MAHMIDTMAWNGETPWHGLGVEVPETVTIDEMLEAAGLDWEVRTNNMYTKAGGKTIRVPGKKALVRMDRGTVLDVVGEDWEPVQNTEAFEFFREFAEKGSIKLHTAGSLDEGRMVWVLGKVGEDFEVLNGDRVEAYLLFSNPHKYGAAIQIGFTPIRVVCNNTLSMALQGKNDMMVRMTHRSKPDFDMVKATLGIVHEKMIAYREAAEFLGTRMANDDQINEYLAKLFPVSGKREGLSLPARRIKDVIDIQPGADFARGSWWNAFNAVTFYTDHLSGRNDNDARNRRFREAMYGTLRRKKIEAFNLALDMAA